MILARFGYESFYVNSSSGIYTPSNLSFEYGKTVEKQSTAGKKPVTYIGDVNLVASGFKLHLDGRFVNVQEKIDAWRNMAEGNGTYVYTIGGKLVSSNKFIVLTVKESNPIINGRGEKISADLDISIEEYAGNQSQKLKTKPLETYS